MYAHTRTTTSPAEGRKGTLVVLFAVWLVAVAWVLLELQRPGGRARVSLAGAEGWTLRYILPNSTPTETAVATHLLRRGHLPGITEEVWVAKGWSWSRALLNSGWSVSEIQYTPGDGKPAALCEIHSPDGQLKWRGAVDASLAPGNGLLDTELLARVVRGEAPPRVVGIGCISSL